MKISKWIALLSACAVLTTTAGCVALFEGESGSSSGFLSETSSYEKVESNSSDKSSSAPSLEDSTEVENSTSSKEENSSESSSEKGDSSGDGASSDDGGIEEAPEVDEIYRMRADDKYVAIDVQNSISAKVGQMSFITKESYQGIKRIAFRSKSVV